ncbi:MAG: protease HtpX, partial [Geobacter sp.]
YRAQEVTEAESPEFYRLVRQLTVQAGLPMPKVYIIPSDTPNAFATGRNPEHAAVAATSGILRILSREELMGVMAHELAHVKHRDILISTIAATVAGAITYLAHMAQWAAIFGGGRDRDDDGGGMLGLLVMAIVAPLAALLIQMAISRSREYDADKGGAAMSGNPLYLANALRKLESANRQLPMQEATPASAHMFIVNPLSGGGLASLFSTHPPMEERVRRLEEMASGRRF